MGRTNRTLTSHACPVSYHGDEGEDILDHAGRHAVGLVRVLQNHTHKVVEEHVGSPGWQFGELLQHNVEGFQGLCLTTKTTTTNNNTDNL